MRREFAADRGGGELRRQNKVNCRRAAREGGLGHSLQAEPKKKDSPAAVLLFGDPSGIRTPDPLLKRQLLCLLS